MYDIFNQILKANLKNSRIVVCLATIFYSANKEFYLPIEELCPYSYTKNGDATLTSTALNNEIEQALIKSQLNPPCPQPQIVISYLINRIPRAPPKYKEIIEKITKIISSAVEKKSELKIKVSVCIAFYFCKYTTSFFDVNMKLILKMMHVSKETFRNGIKNIKSCRITMKRLKRSNLCIKL